MKLNQFFDSSEFECKCGCGYFQIDDKLLRLLNELRILFDKPVIINSGCRCSEHNRKVGGSPKSQHLLGKASDIVIKDISPKTVYEYIDKTYLGLGLGLYDTFVHVDVREVKTRWDLRKNKENNK